jgi:hypothetical protein
VQLRVSVAMTIRRMVIETVGGRWLGRLGRSCGEDGWEALHGGSSAWAV